MPKITYEDEIAVYNDPVVIVLHQLTHAISDLDKEVQALAKDNGRLHTMNTRLLILAIVTLVSLLTITLPFAINVLLGG